MSRLDYCNAALAGLPASTLAPLQRALNAVARLMVGTVTGDRVGDVMRSLHWLPIAYRIRFKLCLLMHAVNNCTGPAYIADITTPISMVSYRVNKSEDYMVSYKVNKSEDYMVSYRVNKSNE